MSDAEALGILLNGRQPDHEPHFDTVLDVRKLCRGHPLTLRVVAGLKENVGLSWRDILAELQHKHQRGSRDHWTRKADAYVCTDIQPSPFTLTLKKESPMMAAPPTHQKKG